MFILMTVAFTQMRLMRLSKKTLWSSSSPNKINLVVSPLGLLLRFAKPEWQVRKASHCGSKQQLSSRAAITLRVR